MPADDLDAILNVLENPTRRKILEKLVKEVHYPLQLSKELNVSQQAIMKHLKVLEDHGLVESFEEKSDAGGPPRKCYRPTRNFSIRIDFGPNTFRTRLVIHRGMTPVIVEDEASDTVEPGQTVPGGDEAPEKDAADAGTVDVNVPNPGGDTGGAGDPGLPTDEYGDILADLHQVLEMDADQTRLSELISLVKRIDSEFEELDSRRGHLLMYREAAMREVNRIVLDLVPSYESRRVIYYYLDETRPTISAMSEDLDLREKVIRDIFNNLQKKRLYFDPFE